MATNDGLIHFFLLKLTDHGVRAPVTARAKNRAGIHTLVKASGGECELFSSQGGVYDAISVVRGVSTADAIKITTEIDRGGFVKATLLPAVKILKGP